MGLKSPVSEPADHATSSRSAQTHAPRGRHSKATTWSWIAAGLIFALIATPALLADFRDRSLVGDQASFLLQGLSLARDGHNLSFDQADLDAWQSVGWTDYPDGLFTQLNSDGYAFAKPYGYSLWLAPFLVLFSAPFAVALANTTLLVILTVLLWSTLRLRYDGPTVPWFLIAFIAASYVYTYTYVVHAELFLATLVAAFGFLVLRAHTTRRLAPALLAAALAGFLVTEKAPSAVVVLPLIAVLIVTAPSWRRTVLLGGTSVATFLLASAPYYYYSDGASLTPYGGDRYYSLGVPPFIDPTNGVPTNTAEKFEIGSSLRDALADPLSSAKSLFYYFFGRHTGMSVFVPIATVVLIMAAIKLRRDRNVLAVATLGGILLYVFFYAVRFTDNYYGGAQSFGNRYFLQISPLVALLAATAHVSARKLTSASIACAFAGAVLLWPHHVEPERSFGALSTTSPIQRLFPRETNQRHARLFRCDYYACDWADADSPEEPNAADAIGEAEAQPDGP